jgi:hypothetical protein
MERDVLLAERILLQTLGFDLNITHPYQYFRQIIGRDLKGRKAARYNFPPLVRSSPLIVGALHDDRLSRLVFRPGG